MRLVSKAQGAPGVCSEKQMEPATGAEDGQETKATGTCLRHASLLGVTEGRLMDV